MPVATELINLNLGCGQTKLPGYIGVDNYDSPTADVVFDLDDPMKPWPWEDNSVKYINLTHVLEHMYFPIHVMNEAYRVLAPGGEIHYRGPHARSSGAWQDPTHTRPLPEEFFFYFDKEFRAAQAITYAGYKCDFKLSDGSYILHEDYKKMVENGLTQIQLQFDMIHKFNVATDFICRLTKRVD